MKIRLTDVLGLLCITVALVSLLSGLQADYDQILLCAVNHEPARALPAKFGATVFQVGGGVVAPVMGKAAA